MSSPPSVQTSLPPFPDASVPRWPEELTPAWLTACLRYAGALRDGSVTGVEVEQIGVGQGFAGRIYRLHLQRLPGDASVDLARLWTELPAGLDALDRYAAAIARFIGPKP